MGENEVILGVDTPLDTHVGVLISRTETCVAVATDTNGYLKLVTWANSFGMLKRAGMEGTRTYGAGLARVLRIMASRCWRFTAPIAPNAGSRESPIPPTLSPRLDPFFRETP